MSKTSGILKSLLIILLSLDGLARAGWYSSVSLSEHKADSETSKYIAFCTETAAPAILAPRTENKQINLSQRKIFSSCCSTKAKIHEKELVLSILSEGSLPFILASQLKSHSLYTIHCLLTV
jgi:hypothetical protein